MNQRVLVVEDDEAMRIGLKDGLEYEGFSVEVAPDGETALELWKQTRPALVLLDVMLPRLSGIDVCKRIRKEDPVPIIMLTARGQEIDKVLGLKLGADDYVTKPFSFLELSARIGAVLRRSGGTLPVEAYTFGDVEVSFKRGELMRAGEAIKISALELKLLEFFVAHRGEVVSREKLLEDVWGQPGDLFTRTVDVHVAKLRKKIEPQPLPRYIVTIHNSGYKFTG